MAADLILLRPAKDYIKKLKDEKLKSALVSAIKVIQEDYTIGTLKSGNLAGVYGYDVFYNKTNYEISYRVTHDGDNVVIVIMVGTRENFYQELKRYMKKEKQL